jgi:excisionase family DNA binding protein
MLTVAEVAAVLGIKEATVRAWVSKRKITYVKVGRLVRIPAKEIKMLIERATIPSRS